MRKALALIASYSVARGVQAIVRVRPDIFHSWERTSFNGSSVSLTQGLAGAAAVATSSFFLPGKKERCAALTGIASAGIAGAIDDHFEQNFPAKGKGFSGHIGALKEGKITSGVLKIALIGAGSALCALGLPRSKGMSTQAKVCTWFAQTALIAGTANLVNLLDLRPGRALKVCLVGAAVGLAPRSTPRSCASRSENSISSAYSASFTRDSSFDRESFGRGSSGRNRHPYSGAYAFTALGAGVLGAAAATLPQDLSGRTMLGDLGANALGASLGIVAASTKPKVMWSLLGAVTALTAASEKYSFSAVIENNPVLRTIDHFGRP